MLTAGSRLGPYEILAPLGAGGMGEVWRARDERLRRDVAIKVLPEVTAHSEAALGRFEREARSVAALSHPNILAIHDFGKDHDIVYAVMELLEGATLRERLGQATLALSRALEWAHQIAQGLAAAHERGIVHRDLKPENIFVTRDEIVKILDFGLALVEEREPSPEDVTLAAKTAPGLVVGTLGYLSPEQARGETADYRSDIFAFGVVLFEMLTGHPAFLRGTSAETLVAILREEPPPLSVFGKVVPAEVEEILRHCLEKSRDERFRSARDLAFALRLAIRAATAPPADAAPRQTPRPSDSGARASDLSIAVLPFRNLSTTAEAEYFSDGMTEEIINSISNLPSLKVAARTSSFAFKGRADDVRKIGRELGVAMVLEGSIRQVGTRLRVSAQLINVESGYQLWSDRWDKEMADVFAVQDEIAQAIASTLKLRLGESEGAAGMARTQNVEAYDRYLKGRHLLALRRVAEAIGELEAATDADPEFVDAHNSLADAWAIRGFYGGIATWEAWARARAAVDDAEQLAPHAAGIPLSRAILEHYYGWNTAREEEFCRRAIERNPKSAEGWNWLGLCQALLGRTREALESTARGIELEFYHPNVRTSSAWAFIITGDYESGERILAKALELNPNAAYANWSRGIALRFMGRYGESIEILERLVEASESRLPFYVALLGGALAAAGERSRAEQLLDELLTRRQQNDFVASLDLATVYSGLGDDESTLDALERARDERNALVWARIYFPDHLRLRAHPRWQLLAQRLSRAAPVAHVMRGRDR